jgi:hypothetical protein
MRAVHANRLDADQCVQRGLGPAHASTPLRESILPVELVSVPAAEQRLAASAAWTARKSALALNGLSGQSIAPVRGSGRAHRLPCAR